MPRAPLWRRPPGPESSDRPERQLGEDRRGHRRHAEDHDAGQCLAQIRAEGFVEQPDDQRQVRPYAPGSQRRIHVLGVVVGRQHQRRGGVDSGREQFPGGSGPRNDDTSAETFELSRLAGRLMGELLGCTPAPSKGTR